MTILWYYSIIICLTLFNLDRFWVNNLEKQQRQQLQQKKRSDLFNLVEEIKQNETWTLLINTN